ncbi:MAG: DinB family protein [Armatimonadota bacterium]|nr:DinB family protein [Armatimonadota bacterium]MDR7405090.1 DinB family protein [Armatimonadota bacterium]MDR7473205.1 DinB family protein [Armatimonadota bacterium]MDR7509348.1 DinB family protein [Armatimonadota bacterium]MDR7517789.1 DinB family protein [Armatimonadota bacterium]
MEDIGRERFVEAVEALLEEIHVGPPDPRSTWVVSNEPASGVLGTLEAISAGAASRPPAPGMNTIAAHAAHLRYALDLAARALAGEDAYASADWAGSWRTQVVTAPEWDRLRADLRQAHRQLLQAIRDRQDWSDRDTLWGVLALVGHGGYHLGAIRQIARLLRESPPPGEGPSR